jgi:alpha-methylacyl-CoA racemase
MALKGLKVLEMAGLAPVPYAGMILAGHSLVARMFFYPLFFCLDFGASVVRVEKIQATSSDTLGRGKRSISINLKDDRGQQVFKQLSSQSDVLIDSYRPGVMEKMGLGPTELLQANPQLIYARLTGYGQTGPLARKAGHDINYVSMSGVLSMLGQKHETPFPPINLLADFGGGGLLCTLGILIAILERSKTGQGQIIDSSMTEGVSYLATFLRTTQKINSTNRDWSSFLKMTGSRGTNILDSGAPFYQTYLTADGKFMAVGALEPQFYKNFVAGLGLDESIIDHQLDVQEWDKLKQLFTEQFAKKTQAEWVKIFQDSDACVTPVLSMEEATNHPHHQKRRAFTQLENKMLVPTPSPKLSSSPGAAGKKVH